MKSYDENPFIQVVDIIRFCNTIKNHWRWCLDWRLKENERNQGNDDDIIL